MVSTSCVLTGSKGITSGGRGAADPKGLKMESMVIVMECRES